jgi:TPR repeat protein
LSVGALSNHGPSAYYMGIMKTYGYGTKVDYAEAMHWFDLAATSGDDRVSEDAFNNAQELNSLLQEAEAHNSAIQDSYRLRQEDGAEL